MVAAAAQKKVRVNGPDGKLQWVYPDEAARMNPQREAVAAMTAADLGWDGEEIAVPDMDYEDYLNAMPTRAEVKPFAQPVHYWEPFLPGCGLQPYPRMGAFNASESGIWSAHNIAQESTIRSRLAKELARAGYEPNPDLLKLSDLEWATMQGRGPVPVRYCHSPACRWVCCSPLADAIHEASRGHTTSSKPREK